MGPLMATFMRLLILPGMAGGNWVTPLLRGEVFMGVAAVEITSDGTGPTLSLRLSKKEGIPIHLVPEGTPGASIVAVKRVDELGFYNHGAKQLSEKLGLTMPKAVAVVDHLGILRDPDCYKEFKIGSVLHKRYSVKAIEKITAGLQQCSADDIWAKRHRMGRDIGA